MIKIHLRSSIFQSFMISNLLILKWQPFQYNKKIRKNFMKKLPFFNTNLIGISITLRLAHMLLLCPLCFKAHHMKSYDCQQLWHRVCTIPLNNMPQFRVTVCSPPWLKGNWEGRGQPKRACPWLLCWIQVCSPQAITPSQNHLPSYGDYDSVPEQLLTHTAQKCDSSDQKTGTDSLFGSIKCMQLNRTAWISTMHC